MSSHRQLIKGGVCGNYLQAAAVRNDDQVAVYMLLVMPGVEHIEMFRNLERARKYRWILRRRRNKIRRGASVHHVRRIRHVAHKL
jgi:hypothetical protein